MFNEVRTSQNSHWSYQNFVQIDKISDQLGQLQIVVNQKSYQSE